MALTLIDQLLDKVPGGTPDLLMMSRRTRRKLKSLLQSSTHYVERGETSFGRMVMMSDGIPVEITDFQPDDETGAVGGSNLSSLYAIHFSEADGLVGLQNGGLEGIDLGQLESKDAPRARVRWYVSIALARDSAVARPRSINAS